MFCLKLVAAPGREPRTPDPGVGLLSLHPTGQRACGLNRMVSLLVHVVSGTTFLRPPFLRVTQLLCTSASSELSAGQVVWRVHHQVFVWGKRYGL